MIELDRLEKKYGKKFKEIFKIITTDNGVEFIAHKRMEDSRLFKSTMKKQ